MQFGGTEITLTLDDNINIDEGNLFCDFGLAGLMPVTVHWNQLSCITPTTQEISDFLLMRLSDSIPLGTSSTIKKEANNQ
eukprot:11508790-Ditylum_brightwellii.AAC.1